jgi:hypothetical protein
MADKAAIIVLADTQDYEGMGRVVNAMITVKEYKEAGEEVKLILDGAGTRWVKQFTKPDQPYRELYDKVKDKVSVCEYCAGAFNVAKNVEEQNLPVEAEYDGHPSIRKLLNEGWKVVTF